MNFSREKKDADGGESGEGEFRENPATRQNTPVGESRSSLDPRDSDTTCRKEGRLFFERNFHL